MASVEVSINQLPVINEINRGDFIIVQTPNATKRLDFVDFVIGLENTTFRTTIEESTTNITSLSDSLDTTNSTVSIISDTVDNNVINIDALSGTVSNNVINIDALSGIVESNTTVLSSAIDNNSTLIDELSGTFYEEPPVIAAGSSTHGIPITIGGVSYYILLSASS